MKVANVGGEYKVLTVHSHQDEGKLFGRIKDALKSSQRDFLRKAGLCSN